MGSVPLRQCFRYSQGRIARRFKWRESGVLSQRIYVGRGGCGEKQGGDIGQRSRLDRDRAEKSEFREDIGERMLERSSSSVLELGLSHKPSTRIRLKAEAQEEQRSNDARRTRMQRFLLLVRGA